MVGQDGIDIIAACTFGREIAAGAETEVDDLVAFRLVELVARCAGHREGGLEFVFGKVERVGFRGGSCPLPVR